MVSRLTISWAMIGCLSVIGYFSIFGSNFIDVFAQEAEELIVRRVAIWDLFLSGYGSGFCSGSAGTRYINLHILEI